MDQLSRLEKPSDIDRPETDKTKYIAICPCGTKRIMTIPDMLTDKSYSKCPCTETLYFYKL